MGVVYEAHDPAIDRKVAIKLVRTDLLAGQERQDYVERFRREAQAAGRCNHPAIVAIYDFALHEGDPFLAMEYVEGLGLDQALAHGEGFAPDAAVHVVLQVLDALDYAHARGIVHRDIKPANILLMAGGRVKVMDFGIARIDSSDLSLVGMVIGTPRYMSPEQCRGETVDSRSDLFSAAVMLQEMLIGQRPFPGRSFTEIAHRLLNEPPAGCGRARCRRRSRRTVSDPSRAGQSPGRPLRFRGVHGRRTAPGARRVRAPNGPRRGHRQDSGRRARPRRSGGALRRGHIRSGPVDANRAPPCPASGSDRPLSDADIVAYCGLDRRSLRASRAAGRCPRQPRTVPLGGLGAGAHRLVCTHRHRYGSVATHALVLDPVGGDRARATGARRYLGTHCADTRSQGIGASPDILGASGTCWRRTLAQPPSAPISCASGKGGRNVAIWPRQTVSPACPRAEWRPRRRCSWESPR